MPLVLEDGTQVSGANTYALEATVRAELADYGQNLSTSVADAEIEILKAMNYIESLRHRFIGNKASKDQALQWPRYSAVVDGYLIASDEIPDSLITALSFAAYEISQGADIQASDSGRKIAREKLGDLEVAYFENESTDSSVIYTRVMDALQPLLVAAGNIPLVRT